MRTGYLPFQIDAALQGLRESGAVGFGEVSINWTLIDQEKITTLLDIPTFLFHETLKCQEYGFKHFALARITVEDTAGGFWVLVAGLTRAATAIMVVDLRRENILRLRGQEWVCTKLMSEPMVPA